MENASGHTTLLKKKYNLHTSQEVDDAALRFTKRTGSKLSTDPSRRIQNYLDRFREITDREDPLSRGQGVEAIKRLLHKNYLIKPFAIPDTYWENQKRMLWERGQGGDFNEKDWENFMAQKIDLILADQRSSLDTWIEYLSSPDAPYSDAVKYWTLRSVLSMTVYDKERGRFPQRSRSTIKPFPELNREALAYVIDAIESSYHHGRSGHENEDLDPAFSSLLHDENFSKLYAFALEKVTPDTPEGLATIRGEWTTYHRNTDHMPLVESLQGHGTGWCTAGVSTAEEQIKDGDIHVYYSVDADGKPTIPRVAIRMDEEGIAEVRGVAMDQNVDEFILPVVEQKLEEFPDGNIYQKKIEDMERVTKIDKKIKGGGSLDWDDLRFLYEIDAPIQGFGHADDPRIEELLAGQTIKKDLAYLLGRSEDEIGLTRHEVLSGGIKYYYGAVLDLSDITTANGLDLPEIVNGDLDLGVRSSENLLLPQSVKRSLYLFNLRSANGLQFPESVGGMVSLSNLQSAEDVILPRFVGGDLSLERLTSLSGIHLPDVVKGVVFLTSIEPDEKEKLQQQYPHLHIR